MNLITIDFETFYDVGFSLSRMTTEEYINDERFQVIGVAIKIDDKKTMVELIEWFPPHEEVDLINQSGNSG